MSRLFITGGTLIDPERRERIDANLLVDDGVIRAFLPRGDEAPEGAKVLPAQGARAFFGGRRMGARARLIPIKGSA